VPARQHDRRCATFSFLDFTAQIEINNHWED
jgi:hypothetical protein